MADKDRTEHCADGSKGQVLARTVHRMQATGHLRCANCGRDVGDPHAIRCHAFGSALIHLRDHLVDGGWHDNCWACVQRRERGGTGLEAVVL